MTESVSVEKAKESIQKTGKELNFSAFEIMKIFDQKEPWHVLEFVTRAIEDERRIGKNEYREKLRKEIETRRNEWLDFLPNCLTEQSETESLSCIEELDWVLKVLDDAEME